MVLFAQCSLTSNPAPKLTASYGEYRVTHLDPYGDCVEDTPTLHGSGRILVFEDSIKFRCSKPSLYFSLPISSSSGNAWSHTLLSVNGSDTTKVIFDKNMDHIVDVYLLHGNIGYCFNVDTVR